MFKESFCFGWLLVACCGFGGAVTAGEWMAGVAKVSITPEEALPMAGYGGRDAPAEGKLSELWAKALVLRSGASDGASELGVMITLDLVGIDRGVSKAICQALADQYELHRHQVTICSSHTHTGPVVGMNLAPLHYLIQPVEQQQRIDRYVEWLQRKVVAMVGVALADLQPCQLAWGNGRATFAVNRRENSAEQVPQWRTEGVLKGPVDHDVPVLSVRDADGDLKALLFGYACHATVLSSLQWSGDYPGFAQMELEQHHPGCTALFWAGCGADQNPLPRRSAELARHYGRSLASAVDAVVMTSAMTTLDPSLSMTYAEIDLPLAELPQKEQLERDAMASDRYTAARARWLLEKSSSEPLAQSYPFPVSTWKIGNTIQFIALGGEVVVDYAARLKTELMGTRTWVASYTHDVMAYIPSRRVLREGGYEGGGAMVYYGLPTIWAPEVEELIVAEVHRQCRQHAAEVRLEAAR